MKTTTKVLVIFTVIIIMIATRPTTADDFVPIFSQGIFVNEQVNEISKAICDINNNCYATTKTAFGQPTIYNWTYKRLQKTIRKTSDLNTLMTVYRGIPNWAKSHGLRVEIRSLVFHQIWKIFNSNQGTREELAEAIKIANVEDLNFLVSVDYLEMRDWLNATM